MMASSRLLALTVAVLAGPVIMSGSAVLAQAPPPIPLARDVLAELVAIRTTAAEGTADAARALEKRLVAAGFPAADVRVLGRDPKAANLVVRYRGTRQDARAVLFAAHLDVVPAERDRWTADPFVLTERDGWLYGRGSVDNKAGAAMLVASFVHLKRAGWQPSRDLIIVLTADEETSQDSIQWLLADHRSLIDAELAFNTDSGGVLLRDGKPALFEVQVSEKIYADYQLEATDAGGHSSLVRPDNPITHLSSALVRIGEHQFPLHMSDASRMYFERAADSESGQTAIDMRAVARVPPDPAAAVRLSRSAFLNAQLRTTCVATRVEAGHANNALPQRARAIVNCRILPGLPVDEVEGVLRRLAGDKVAVTVVERPVPSPPSPLTADVMTRLEALVRKQWPKLPLLPVMATGATDGLYLRSAGIPTYGVSALEHDPDDARAHGIDERVAVRSFGEAVRFWLELMQSL